MKYVVESEHNEDECLKALDEMLEKGENVLSEFVFGCKSGEHIGWAYIDANSEKEALEIVPEFIRDKACAHEVGSFTAEDIRKAHSK